MCLTVKNNTKIETAQEDIICYKVFKIVFYLGGLVSYYQGMRYSLNVLYTLEKPSLKIKTYVTGPVVEEGFHSFIYRESAQMFLNVCDHVKRPLICKCKIPKGAKFVRGTFTDGYSSYESICSDQIIVLQEV